MSAKSYSAEPLLPVRRPIAGMKSAGETMRTLLKQMTTDIGDYSPGKAPDDMGELTSKVRDVLVVIVSHLQAHPHLVNSFTARQRDMLFRVMVASKFQQAPAINRRQRLHSDQAAAHRGDQFSVEDSILPRAFYLLGGSRLLRHRPSTQAEIHAAVVKGIPYSALFFLTANTKGVAEEDVANVLGVSTRTLRRQKETPEKAMPPDLGSKTWLFAETLAKAEDVLGSKEDAERWMVEEAMGLDGARPIDLLRTAQGANLVSRFLERLKYGVYN